MPLSYAFAHTCTSSEPPDSWNWRPLELPRSTSSSDATRLAATDWSSLTSVSGQMTVAFSATASQWLLRSVKPPAVSALEAALEAAEAERAERAASGGLSAFRDGAAVSREELRQQWLDAHRGLE